MKKIDSNSRNLKISIQSNFILHEFNEIDEILNKKKAFKKNFTTTEKQ